MVHPAFDTAVITENGRELRLRAQAFLAMSLHERVRLLLEQRVRLMLDGEPVDAKRALLLVQSHDAFGKPRDD